MDASRQEVKNQKIITPYGKGVLFSSQKTKKCILAFFGNRHLNQDRVQKWFPSKQLVQLKQTHSNTVLDCSAEVPSTEVSGDAAFSKNQMQLLMVKTADCLPLLYLSENLDIHGFIHAGWRGVENQIVPRFLEQVMKNNLGHGILMIGPHITQKNFEVDQDVAHQILKTILSNEQIADLQKNPLQNPYFFLLGKKWHLNLVAVCKAQMEKWKYFLAIKEELIHDVYEDFEYFSYRREHQNSGRNLSFTVLLEDGSMLPDFSLKHE